MSKELAQFDEVVLLLKDKTEKLEEEALKLAGHFQCYSCGLKHRKVEAGGIYYCPNPFCTISGATWFRKQLESFEPSLDNTYTVDNKEWYSTAVDYTIKEIKDPLILKYALQSAKILMELIQNDKAQEEKTETSTA